MAFRLPNRLAPLSVLILAALLIMMAASLQYQSEMWFRVLGTDISAIFLRPLFTIGRIAVSPSFVLKSLIFVAALTLVSRWVEKVLRTRVLSHTALDAQHRYTLARLSSLAVFVMGLIVGVDTAGVDLRSLALLGSALGLGVGLGLQPIIANFVAGLILLMERPVKLGDRIDVGGTNGAVVRIGGRSTWVCTNDNEVIIVPNSDFITNRVINWTANDPKVRFALKVGVSYESDPQKVKAILLQLAAAHSGVLPDPPPEVIFSELGDSSLNFLLRIWTAKELGNPQALKSDLYFSIFESFREHGIEMPFPQRDLHYEKCRYLRRQHLFQSKSVFRTGHCEIGRVASKNALYWGSQTEFCRIICV
jgi:small-conductance mechanosensitive channel